MSDMQLAKEIATEKNVRGHTYSNSGAVANEMTRLSTSEANVSTWSDLAYIPTKQNLIFP